MKTSTKFLVEAYAALEAAWPEDDEGEPVGVVFVDDLEGGLAERVVAAGVPTHVIPDGEGARRGVLWSEFRDWRSTMDAMDVGGEAVGGVVSLAGHRAAEPATTEPEPVDDVAAIVEDIPVAPAPESVVDVPEALPWPPPRPQEPAPTPETGGCVVDPADVLALVADVEARTVEPALRAAAGRLRDAVSEPPVGVGVVADPAGFASLLRRLPTGARVAVSGFEGDATGKGTYMWVGRDDVTLTAADLELEAYRWAASGRGRAPEVVWLP